MLRFILIASAVFAIAFCGRDSGEGGRGRGPRTGPHGRMPPPPYLRNVTEEARQEYFQITKNRNETIAAQKQEVQTWGQKYGVLDQVNEFEANMTRFKNELNQNVTQLISQLSQGQQQLSQIMENENQTFEEQHQAMMQFRNSSKNVFETLMFMGGLFRPRGPHGPHGGPDGDFGGRGSMGGRGDMGGRGGPRAGSNGQDGQGQGQGSRGGPQGFQGFQSGPDSNNFGSFGGQQQQQQFGFGGQRGGF